MKIVSGGQTGADRGGLDFALENGFECGGFCPAGRRAEDGVIPARYPLTPTNSPMYDLRTELNVCHSDGTVIFTRLRSNNDPASRGSLLTRTMCRKWKKPYLVYVVFQEGPSRLADFLIQHNIKVLNVAGSRESNIPGIQVEVKRVLLKAFKEAGLLHDRDP